MKKLISDEAQAKFDAHRKSMDEMHARHAKWKRTDRRVTTALNLGLILTGAVAVIYSPAP